jgi:hypothetical protein
MTVERAVGSHRETLRPRPSQQTSHAIFHSYTSFRTLSVTYAMMASYTSTEAKYLAGRRHGTKFRHCYRKAKYVRQTCWKDSCVLQG